jgi:hypothetical protein
MRVVRHETEHCVEGPLFGDFSQKIGETANNAGADKGRPAILNTEGERRRNPSAITVSRQTVMLGSHNQINAG